MWSARSPLTVEHTDVSGSAVLVSSGVLDGSTYLTMRNAIIKAALDEPRAVVVDVNALSVPAPSAWVVLTSARWLVSTWPDVPVVVACASTAVRDTLARVGITRYVPTFPSVAHAASDMPPSVREGRRRARAELPTLPSSVAVARDLVTRWLTTWSRSEFVAAATVITTVLMDNAVGHGGETIVLRAESDDTTITIVVCDSDPEPPVRHESPTHGSNATITEWNFLDVLCRHWGHLPAGPGKAVWAVIGPEKRL